MLIWIIDCLGSKQRLLINNYQIYVHVLGLIKFCRLVGKLKSNNVVFKYCAFPTINCYLAVQKRMLAVS